MGIIVAHARRGRTPFLAQFRRQTSTTQAASDIVE